jgi:hypothetical protein
VHGTFTSHAGGFLQTMHVTCTSPTAAAVTHSHDVLADRAGQRVGGVVCAQLNATAGVMGLQVCALAYTVSTLNNTLTPAQGEAGAPIVLGPTYHNLRHINRHATSHLTQLPAWLLHCCPAYETFGRDLGTWDHACQIQQCELMFMSATVKENNRPRQTREHSLKRPKSFLRFLSHGYLHQEAKQHMAGVRQGLFAGYHIPACCS